MSERTANKPATPNAGIASRLTIGHFWLGVGEPGRLGFSIPIAPMNDQSPRRLPQWSWVLAALFFPSGVFVAYGCAKLLSWARAGTLAILSYGCIIGFVQLMVRLEHGSVSGLVRSIAILGGLTMLSGWGSLLYSIGQRVGYWSPTVQRGWRRAGWFAIVVLCLAGVSIALQFIDARRHGS